MSIHLDSNVVIEILNGRTDFRDQCRRLSLAGEGLFVSTIVMFELWYGVVRSRHFKENAEGLLAFVNTLDGVLPFTSDHARTAAEIRDTLRKMGRPIGPYDLLIAAHAIRAGATLVTANASEFGRVSGLKWQDWTK